MNKINQLRESLIHFIIKYKMEPTHLVLNSSNERYLSNEVREVTGIGGQWGIEKMFPIKIVLNDHLVGYDEFMLCILEKPEKWITLYPELKKKVELDRLDREMLE